MVSLFMLLISHSYAVFLTLTRTSPLPRPPLLILIIDECVDKLLAPWNATTDVWVPADAHGHADASAVNGDGGLDHEHFDLAARRTSRQ